MFKPYYKYNYELNLQELSQHFFDVYDENFDFDEEFRSQVLELVSTAELWRTKHEVKDELLRLFEEESFWSTFIGGYDSQVQDIELEIEHQINKPQSSEEIRKRVIEYTDLVVSKWKEDVEYYILYHEEYIQSLNGSLKAENQCAHFFTPLAITRKNSSNYNYFFAFACRQYDAENIIGFLDFQFENEFGSNFKDFARFLLVVMSERDYLIGETKVKLIREWIELNRHGHSEGAKGDGIPKWTHTMEIIKLLVLSEAGIVKYPTTKQLRDFGRKGNKENPNRYKAHLAITRRDKKNIPPKLHELNAVRADVIADYPQLEEKLGKLIQAVEKQRNETDYNFIKLLKAIFESK